MKPVLVVALTAIIGFTAACKKDDALKGIDKQALFAPATSTEIADVQTLWAQRNLIPTDVAIEEAHSITDQLSVSVISFRVSNIKEYAAVLAPTAGRPLPIMFYVGGFSAEQSPVSPLQIKLKAADSLPFIYVVPALRGQSVSLQVNETTYNSPLSEGSRFDAFDGATDDVIAALNAVGMLFANADTATAMIRGGSRGGTVALLAGERDQRFKRVAPVAFNVEFIGLTASLYNDPTYKGQFLEGLMNGTASIADARRTMIASSPLYFCGSLPKTQLHVAANDKITPLSQAELLMDAMKARGLEESVELFVYPDRDHESIGTNNQELEDRIYDFFGQVW